MEKIKQELQQKYGKWFDFKVYKYKSGVCVNAIAKDNCIFSVYKYELEGYSSKEKYAWNLLKSKLDKEWEKLMGECVFEKLDALKHYVNLCVDIEIDKNVSFIDFWKNKERYLNPSSYKVFTYSNESNKNKIVLTPSWTSVRELSHAMSFDGFVYIKPINSYLGNEYTLDKKNFKPICKV
jgi:hypothetical protein